MAMPNRLVLIRHGESEPNMIHRAERNGERHEAHDAVYSRPDWLQRLGELGMYQAETARVFVESNIMPIGDFDRRYVSKFLRARETAAIIGLEHTWYPDDRFKERDWGEFGATPYDEREEKFPYAAKGQEDNFWHGRHSGGESMSDSVLMRIRDTNTTFHRDLEGKNVLVVGHGETMTASRYLNERMLPEEIEAIVKDDAQDMKNCTVLDYMRTNPFDPSDVADQLAWMRMIYPYDVKNSPYGGEWQPMRKSLIMTGHELLKSLDIAPPLTR